MELRAHQPARLIACASITDALKPALRGASVIPGCWLGGHLSGKGCAYFSAGTLSAVDEPQANALSERRGARLK
jgi:hypothetical protein